MKRQGTAISPISRSTRSKRRRGVVGQEPGPSDDGDQTQVAAPHTLAAPLVPKPQHQNLGAPVFDVAAFQGATKCSASRSGAIADCPQNSESGDSFNDEDDDANRDYDANGDKDDTDDADQDDDSDKVAVPPAGPPEIILAARRLVELTSLTPEAALNALKETQDRVFGQGGSGEAADRLQAWLEEAQIWLACSMEVQEEIDDVRVAMQESLQEYEAAKAADTVPLPERDADYLRDRFLVAVGSSAATAGAPRSRVVMRLVTFACPYAVFGEGPHKAPLVKLADMECKCRRWYPNSGTNRFWEQVADEVAEVASEAAPGPPALKTEGWVGCTQGPDGCSTCAAALGRDPGDDVGASTSAAATAAQRPAGGTPLSAVLPIAAAAVLTALGTFAARRLREVEEEVCKMPTISGEVPDVFVRLDEPPEEASDGDDIVLVVGGAAEQRPEEVEM